MRRQRFTFLAPFLLALSACQCGEPGSPAEDAASEVDAGAASRDAVVDAAPAEDANPADASAEDLGTADATAPLDAAMPQDAASPDAAPLEDAASPDASSPGDSGVALGSCAATGGFCWIHPLGFGASLSAVFGFADDDVWAVGFDGVIFHRGAAGWSQVVSPVSATLHDVHGDSASDVWAVGESNAVIRYDGRTWQTIAGVTDDILDAVFARAPNDVWVGGHHHLYHYDGNALTPVTLPFSYDVEARAIFAFGPRDVWVGTTFGTGLHFDGQTWSYSDSLYHDHGITDLWASGPGDLWAVSDWGAEISRWDGGRWTRLPYVAGTTPESVISVFGTGAHDVWLTGDQGLWHYDGTNFSHELPPVSPNGTTAPAGGWSSPTLAIVVGGAGQIFEHSGASWRLVSGPYEGIYQRWFSALAFSASDAWFLGLGTSMRYDGHAFSEVPMVQTQYRQDFGGAWASSPADIWAVAVGQWGDNIQRWDGHRWSRVPSGNFNGPDWIDDVWGSGPTDVYFAAMGAPLHWDGQAFSTLSVSFSAQAVHGTGPSDVWMAAGTGGPSPSNGLWHYDGHGWSQSTHDGIWWTGIYAITPSDAWAGGGGGTVEHWDGHTWTPMAIPGLTTADPQNAPFVGGFSAQSGSDVWASAGGRVIHWDGQRWTVLPGFGAGINDVAAAPDGAVFVTGGADAVLLRR
ncbi:MAG: hypothetical protein U1E65_19305 [Myxococcota bacterium]